MELIIKSDEMTLSQSVNRQPAYNHPIEKLKPPKRAQREKPNPPTENNVLFHLFEDFLPVLRGQKIKV